MNKVFLDVVKFRKFFTIYFDTEYVGSVDFKFAIPNKEVKYYYKNC
jgi:hypothetical protein